VLRKVLENILRQLLAFGCQPVLHLALVREEDLLHPLQDHLVSLDLSVVPALGPLHGFPRGRGMGASDARRVGRGVIL